MRNHLLVIRSPDPDRLANFYGHFGLAFTYHKHGKGPYHYSAEHQGWVFEIYPSKHEHDDVDSVMLGFELKGVDLLLKTLAEYGGEIVKDLHKTNYGWQAIIKDLDGRKIILQEEGER